MMRYAAFLRGINLGPHRKVSMADLRRVLTEAGLGDPTTHLRSGNVVFDSGLDPSETATMVRGAIADHFGFEVPVVLMDESRLAEIIESNPYPRAAAADPTKVHATLLDPEPPPSTWTAVEATPPEEFEVRAGTLYMHLPNGLGRSKLAERLGRVTAGVTATTRNWRTIEAMLELIRSR